MLNDGPIWSGNKLVRDADRSWDWAKEQIARAVSLGRPHVTEPPGPRTAKASNSTSRWSWPFLDVYDLQDGGVPWAPYLPQSRHYEHAKALAMEARQWLDNTHPEWRPESLALGLDVAVRRERDQIAELRASIREAKQQIGEHLSDIERLRSVTAESVAGQAVEAA